MAGTYLTVLEEMTMDDFEPILPVEIRFLPRDGYFFDIALEKTIMTKSGRKVRETILFEFDGAQGAYRRSGAVMWWSAPDHVEAI